MTVSLTQAVLTASRAMPADNGYALVPDAALRVLIEHAQNVAAQRKATKSYCPTDSTLSRLADHMGDWEMARFDSDPIHRLREFNWEASPPPVEQISGQVTLNEAIKHARDVMTDTPGAVAASFNRRAVRQLLLHAEAGQALRDVFFKPQVDTDRARRLEQFAMASITGTCPGNAMTDPEVEMLAFGAWRMAEAMIKATP